MKRPLVIAATLTLIAVFSFRWWLPSDRPALPSVSLPDTRFDYSLSDYQARFHDQQGQVELVVSGPRLEHEAARRVVLLDAPRFSLPDPEGGWEGRSEQGEFRRDEDLLELSGQVELGRPVEGGRLQLETEVLQHHRSARTIETDSPFRLARPGTFVTARGLLIELDKEAAELRHDVRIQTTPAADGSARR